MNSARIDPADYCPSIRRIILANPGLSLRRNTDDRNIIVVYFLHRVGSHGNKI